MKVVDLNLKLVNQLYFILGLAFTIGAQTQVIKDCSDIIFGCQTCELFNETEGLAPSDAYTCTSCQPNLYLHWYENYNNLQQQTICVPDCSAVDRNRENDFYHRQCAFLGPFCEQSAFQLSTDTGQWEPQCLYSHMKNFGYVIGSRYYILNYLSQLTSLSETSTYASLPDAYDTAYGYLNPQEPYSLTSIDTDRAMKVVTQCDNSYCKNCNDYRLSQCRFCWGRFASSNGVCLERTDCNTLGNSAFKQGCYQVGDTCMDCKLCEMGYVLRSYNGRCEQCQQTDDNCLDCSEDSIGNVVCDICQEGYGVNATTGVCTPCEGDNIKYCSFDDQNNQTITMCEDEYVLDSNGTSCANKTCGFAQYLDISQFDDDDSNKVIGVQCKDCDPSCRTCFGSQPDQCATCSNDTFLNIVSLGGTCEDKTQASSDGSDDLKILVLNSANKGNFSDDTYQTLQKDLLGALFQAFLQASSKMNQTVTIFMEIGDHFITSTHFTDFNVLLKNQYQADFTNPSFNLVIKPLDCDDELPEGLILNYLSDSCRGLNETDSQKVVVNNKIGSMFNIIAPRSLKIEGIVFEGINSVQNFDSPTSALEQSDCTWSSEDDSFPTCPQLFKSDTLLDDYLLTSRQQVCQLRSYDSFIQMRNIDRDLNSTDEIQKVEISNCTFQNFYFDLGSIVRVPQRKDQDDNSKHQPWKLNISSSSFQNMSLCGSIVSNDYPVFSGANESQHFYQYSQGIKSQIQSLFGSSKTQNVSLDCDDNECYSFTFKNNSVKNLNQLKAQEGEQYFKQRVNWQMEKFGLAIHLKNFQGNIELAGNNFTDTRMNYTDFCQYSALNGSNSLQVASSDENWTQVNNFTTNSSLQKFSQLIQEQSDSYQLHSLVVIENLQEGRQFNLSNNTFTNNVLTSSLLSVSQLLTQDLTDQQSILVTQNNFANSSSYIGSNIMTITKQNSSGEVQVCGQGIEISHNSFTSIVGSCQVDTGLIRVQCNDTLYAEEIALDRNDTNITLINRTRQIAPSRCLGGIDFDQSSLNRLVQQDQNVMVVSGNIIRSSSPGVSQMTLIDSELSPQEFSGSMFSFGEVTFLKMTNNTFEDIQPISDLSFFMNNSQLYQMMGDLIISNQTLTSPASSSMIIAMNPYTVQILNTTATNISAETFSDSVLLYAHDGTKSLVLNQTNLTKVNQVIHPLIKILEDPRCECKQIQGREIAFINSTFDGFVLKSSEESIPSSQNFTSLLIDNFVTLDIIDFQMVNTSFSNIQSERREGVEYPPTFMNSLLSVKATNITLSSNSFENVTLIQTKDLPVFSGVLSLEIFNFDDIDDPQALLINNTFKNITFGVEAQSNIPVKQQGSLISVYHRSLSYDVKIHNCTFDTIQQYFKELVGRDQTSMPTVGSIISTIDLMRNDETNPLLNLEIRSCNFSNAMNLTRCDLKQELVSFENRIRSLTLDNNTFMSLEDLFYSTTDLFPKSLLTLNASKGPQQVLITNSQFTLNQPTQAHQQYMTYALREASAIDFQNKLQSRILFDISNYNSSGHQSQQVAFRNVIFKDMNLLKNDGNEFVFNQQSIGAVIHSRDSNLMIEGITVDGLESQSGGAFLRVENQESSGLNISIQDSLFKGSKSSRKGGVVFYEGDSDGNGTEVQLCISKSIFKENFANESAIIHIDAKGVNVSLSDITVKDNTALYANSFGQLTNLDNQSLQISSSRFESNKVLDGPSLITLVNSSISINDTAFNDNVATFLTHGLRVLNDPLSLSDQAIVMNNTHFYSQQYKDDDVPKINGSYIHISGQSQQQNIEPLRSLNLNISQSSFRMGSSNFGGAIYIADLPQKQNLSLTFDLTDFMYNKAVINGGAIFADDLELFDIQISNSTFESNLVGLYGDNIFARQIRKTWPEQIQDEVSQERRLLLEDLNETPQNVSNQTEQISYPPSLIAIRDSEFMTPYAKNQIYLEQIEQVLLNGTTFREIENSQTLEGGSLSCINCFQVVIYDSDFNLQSSLVRGGALYLEQNNDTYFGQDFNQTYLIESSQFVKCESQQGAAIYYKDIYGLVVNGSTTFSEGLVIHYNESLPFYLQTVENEHTGRVITKNYTEIESELLMGKGPGIYFDCDQGCNLTIANDTEFIDQRIITRDASWVDTEPERVESIFYTNVKPNIKPIHKNEAIRQFTQKIDGSDFVLLYNLTELQLLKKQADDKFQFDYETGETIPFNLTNYWNITNNGTEFADEYDTQSFKIRNSSIFGDMPIVIVNNQSQAQMYDHFSVLTIDVTQTSLENWTTSEPPVDILLLEENEMNFNFNYSRKRNFTASQGIFQIPKLFLQGMPGANVTMTLTAQLNSTVGNNYTIVKNVSIITKQCDRGSVMDSRGLCSMCQGPDLYMVEDAASQGGWLQVQDCERCQSEIFTCNGGADIQSVAGFQRVQKNKDVFVQCDTIDGVNNCLENNTCSSGYRGLLCNQCDAYHYRAITGTCNKCKHHGIFSVIVIAFLVLGFVYFMTNLVKRSQDKNKLPIGFLMTKSLVNYIIYMAIISGIFDVFWMDDSDEASMASKTFKFTVLTPIKAIYSIPYLAVEILQCMQYSSEPDLKVHQYEMDFSHDIALNDDFRRIRNCLSMAYVILIALFIILFHIHIGVFKAFGCSPQQEENKSEESDDLCDEKEASQNIQPKSDVLRIKPVQLDKLTIPPNYDRNQMQSEREKQKNTSAASIGDIDHEKSANNHASRTKGVNDIQLYESPRNMQQTLNVSKGSISKKSKSSRNSSKQNYEGGSQDSGDEKPQNFADRVNSYEVSMKGDTSVRGQQDPEDLKSSIQDLDQASQSLSGPGNQIIEPISNENNFTMGKNQLSDNLKKIKSSSIQSNDIENQTDQEKSVVMKSFYREETPEQSSQMTTLAGQKYETPAFVKGQDSKIQSKPTLILRPQNNRQQDKKAPRIKRDFTEKGMTGKQKQRKTQEDNKQQMEEYVQMKLQKQNNRQQDISIEQAQQQQQAQILSPIEPVQHLEYSQIDSTQNYHNQFATGINTLQMNQFHQRVDEITDIEKRLRQRRNQAKMPKDLFTTQQDDNNASMRSAISMATVGMQNDYQGLDQNPNMDFSNNRLDREPISFGDRYLNNQAHESIIPLQLKAQTSSRSHGKYSQSLSQSVRHSAMDPQSAVPQLDTQMIMPPKPPKSLAKNLQKNFIYFKFDQFTLFSGILVFLVSTQLVDSQLMFYACNDVYYFNSKDKSEEQLKKIGQKVNFYDSTLTCYGENLFGVDTRSDLFLIFILLWLLVGPAYMVRAGGWEYFIDFTSIITKFILLLISKHSIKNLKHSQFTAAVIASFTITFQLVVFLVLKNRRAFGESERISKLQKVNLLDCLLYSNLCFTTYLGLIQSTVSELKQGSNPSKLIYIVLTSINILFVVFMASQMVQVSYGYAKKQPSFAKLLKCLGKSDEEIEQSRKKVDQEEEADQKMEKIDLLIQHLMNVQKDIQANKELQESQTAGEGSFEQNLLLKQSLQSQQKLIGELTSLLNQKNSSQATAGGPVYIPQDIEQYPYEQQSDSSHLQKFEKKNFQQDQIQDIAASIQHNAVNISSSTIGIQEDRSKIIAPNLAINSQSYDVRGIGTQPQGQKLSFDQREILNSSKQSNLQSRQIKQGNMKFYEEEKTPYLSIQHHGFQSKEVAQSSDEVQSSKIEDQQERQESNFKFEASNTNHNIYSDNQQEPINQTFTTSYKLSSNKSRPQSAMEEQKERSKSVMDYSVDSKLTSITHKELKTKNVELSPSKRAETILMDKVNVFIDGGQTDRSKNKSHRSSKKDKSEDDYDPDSLKKALQNIIGGLNSIQYPLPRNGSPISESSNEEDEQQIERKSLVKSTPSPQKPDTKSTLSNHEKSLSPIQLKRSSPSPSPEMKEESKDEQIGDHLNKKYYDWQESALKSMQDQRHTEMNMSSKNNLKNIITDLDEIQTKFSKYTKSGDFNPHEGQAMLNKRLQGSKSATNMGTKDLVKKQQAYSARVREMQQEKTAKYQIKQQNNNYNNSNQDRFKKSEMHEFTNDVLPESINVSENLQRQKLYSQEVRARSKEKFEMRKQKMAEEREKSVESNEAKPLSNRLEKDPSIINVSLDNNKLFQKREENRKKRSVLPSNLKSQVLNKSASTFSGINNANSNVRNSIQTKVIQNSPYNSMMPENQLQGSKSQMNLGSRSRDRLQRLDTAKTQFNQRIESGQQRLKSELDIGSRIENRDFIVEELEQDGRFKVGPKIDQSIQLREQLSGLQKRAKSQQRSRTKLKSEKFQVMGYDLKNKMVKIKELQKQKELLLGNLNFEVKENDAEEQQ